MASILIVGFGVRRTSNRWLWYIATCILGATGGALMSFLPKSNKAGLLAGIYLINCIVPTVMLTYNWMTVNTFNYTEKVINANLGSFLFNLGNLVGPQPFQSRDAPEYKPAKITLMATLLAPILFVLMLHTFHYRSNKSRPQSAKFKY